MTKSLKLIMSICMLISISQISYSIERERNCNLCDEIVSGLNAPVLVYEFGISKSGYIVVTKNNENYRLSFKDFNYKPLKDYIVSNSELLDWAFNDMPREFEKCNYVIDNAYEPFYYSLNFEDKLSSKEFVISSDMHFSNQNDKFIDKLAELRQFLVSCFMIKWDEENNNERTDP